MRCKYFEAGARLLFLPSASLVSSVRPRTSPLRHVRPRRRRYPSQEVVFFPSLGWSHPSRQPALVMGMALPVVLHGCIFLFRRLLVMVVAGLFYFIFFGAPMCPWFYLRGAPGYNLRKIKHVGSPRIAGNCCFASRAWLLFFAFVEAHFVAVCQEAHWHRACVVLRVFSGDIMLGSLCH